MATTVQPQIRVKSYFATCVTDAMDMARKELGPDALWLDSRPAPPEARHLGALEVIFGETAEIARKESPASSVASAEIDDLRKRMEEIRSLLVRTTPSTPYGGARARLVEQVLIDAGLTGPLADELDEAVYLRIKARIETGISRSRRIQEIDPELVLRVTREEMNARIETKEGIGRVTALVGSPGSGKTSTVVKLAIREGLMKGRSVKLISTDTQRIAASEQLRIYAAILGVQFQIAEGPAALAQAVDTAHASSLVLIDTPGLSPALLEGPAADIAASFRHRQDIDVHLVLTASMRQTDMEKAVARFAAFHPAATIFTRLDETDSLATLFCEVVRNRMPVSYLCDGQIVPEDIQPATKDRITEGLVRHLPGVLQSAAA
jgi:flagellar biosynthesis protein FlhF